MSITKTYSCNVCKDTKDRNSLVGLYWDVRDNGWIEKPVITTENHICFKCLSSLQAIEKRCIHGFKCSGGTKCGSDHK